jgi:hypothetical protein
MAGFLISGSKPSGSNTQRVSFHRIRSVAVSLDQPTVHTGRLKAAAIGARTLQRPIE